MKTRLLICSLVMLFALTAYNSYGQTIEKSRSVKEAFKVSPETEIEILNKYGNIHIIPWEKDSVRFEIDLMVRGTKQAKVDKSFDYVEFDFKKTKYYIIAQTLFAGKSSFWSDVSDLTGAIFNSSTKTKIDYTVYIPANVSLKIVNKYGNIYTTTHTGKIDIDLSNGDLKAHHFSGPTKINSEFGNLNVKMIDDGELNISYGELHVEAGERVNIESKSSKFYFEKIEDLGINSRRDKFYLDTVGDIHGLTNFTVVEIEHLQQKLDLGTKYGDIDVQTFGDGVKSVNIISEDTDLTLHFTDDKKYKLDIKVSKDTDVMYSADIKNISSEELEGDDKMVQVDCEIGSKGSRSIPLTISSKAGSLSLKLK